MRDLTNMDKVDEEDDDISRSGFEGGDQRNVNDIDVTESESETDSEYDSEEESDDAAESEKPDQMSNLAQSMKMSMYSSFDGNTGPKVLENGEFKAKLEFSFFDNNRMLSRDYQGNSDGKLEAITRFEVPLSFMTPFKPIHLDVELPINMLHLEDDLSVDHGLKPNPKMAHTSEE